VSDNRKGHFKPCTLDGVTYPSRQAAAAALGVTSSTICERLKPQGKRRYQRRPEKQKTVVQIRKCLMHGGMFRSHHSGERICPSCKTRDIWMNYSPIDVAINMGKRR
jgi:hypothetical protein